MELEYELTSEDYVQFALYHVEHSPTIRRTNLMNMLAGVVIFPLAGYLISLLEHTMLPLFVFCALTIVWIPVWPRYWRYEAQRRVRRMYEEGQADTDTGPSTVRIDSDGIQASSSRGKGLLKWSAVRKIVQSETCTYVYVGAMDALILPHDRFDSDIHREQFIAELRRLREESMGLLTEN